MVTLSAQDVEDERSALLVVLEARREKWLQDGENAAAQAKRLATVLDDYR